MKVLVTGGRNYRDHKKIYNVLDKIDYKYHIEQIISGGARGADTLAQQWAIMRHIPYELYEIPDWCWKTLGKKIGPMRNQAMIDQGSPDLVIAFPGGRGTADMIRRSLQAKIRVKEIE